jgi:protein-disulfide isomerase
MNTTKKGGELMIPVAIVIAAVIIALAVIFTNKGALNTNVNGNQKQDVVEKSLVEYAKQIGIDEKAFLACQNSGKYNDKIKRQIVEAGDAGGQGTPHSIVVTTNGNLIQVSGAQPLEPYKDQNGNIQRGLRGLFDELIAGNNLTNDTTIKLAPITAEDHVNGDINAPIKIVEYSDIDCPFCKRFHSTLEQVKALYGDKVVWVYRHFPITQLHPDSFKKSHATECVAELGGNDKFWQYLKLLSDSE